MDSDERRQRLSVHFDGGFRELQLRDLQHSNDCDVRMGSFVQAAALLDALALAHSAPAPPKTKDPDGRASWKRFVDRYFPAEYQPVITYKDFRGLLLHNFSAGTSLAFDHIHPEQHLQPRADGRIVLDRGRFIAAVTAAFDAFQADALADEHLGARVLAWLDRRPPLGYWIPDAGAPIAGTPGLSAAGLSAYAMSGASYSSSVVTTSGAGLPTIGGMTREPADRPRSKKHAASIKKHKKRKRN
jgi:hypothetical protein